MRRLLAILSAIVMAVPSVAAPTTLPAYRDMAGNLQQSQGFVMLNADGSLATLTGGSGGGDASAANQTLEISKGEQIRALLAAPLAVAQSGVWTVGISGTVPISAAALPLPTGASLASNQASALTKLDTLISNLTSLLANTSGLPTGSPIRTFDETNAIAGRGFSWGTGVVSVNSGNRLNVVFTNPAGSGKTAYIVLREFGQSSTTPLTANLYTNPSIPSGSTTASGGNRLMGAATTSASTISYQVTTTALATGTAGPAVFIAPNGENTDTTLIRIVPPGFSFGYTVMAPGGGLAAATSISVSFAGWEQ